MQQIMAMLFTVQNEQTMQHFCTEYNLPTTVQLFGTHVPLLIFKGSGQNISQNKGTC